MTNPPASRPAAPRLESRSIGAVRGEAAGPTLLCITSLHGNEPAGVHATRRVLRDLAGLVSEMRGAFVAIAGNLRALADGVRFVDEDLNRTWQRARVAAILESLRAGDEGGADSTGRDTSTLPMVGSAELAEQRELLGSIRESVRGRGGPIFLLDLHTTSSRSAPFTTLGDTLQNRGLAMALPIPAVLGLEEQIDGPMLQYFDMLGWAGIGIEGGAHDDPDSIGAQEDAIWLILCAIGILEKAAVPDFHLRRDRLATAARGLPGVVDVRYRHALAPEDGFAMRPGFKNFAAVRKGQILASDARGPVIAPMRGLLFLPLYQKLGDDGFFIVRPVRPIWLGVSRWLRTRGWDRLATWIPGVLRHPDREDAVVLAPWAANRIVIDILHLLGFNARYERGRVVMIRRVESEASGSPLDIRS